MSKAETPEPIRDRHKNTKPVNARVPPDYLTFLDKYYQEQGLKNRSQGLVKILESYRLLGLQTSEEFKPEICKGCPQYGGINNEGILCIIKKSETDPVRFDLKPFAVAKPCSEKPFNTFPDRKSLQRYENEFTLLRTERDTAIARHKRDHGKLELLTGIEKERDNALSEIERLNEDVKRMPAMRQEIDRLQNLVTERSADVIGLKNDNDFLRKTNEELSQDSLTEKYKELLGRYEEAEHLLKIQESNNRANQEESKKELVKLEALVRVGREQNNDIVFTIKKALRDFKQYLPEGSASCTACPDGFKFKEYKQNALKTIENLEGYLQTKVS
ncbi:hypothetical protein MUP01_08650 [Candidatus Bathyarchaeota archaeon]|nr:hypothetical protein [Candidatus Bathyarchaeota archaeon]